MTLLFKTTREWHRIPLASDVEAHRFHRHGPGEARAPNLIIVELKQWSDAQVTEQDGVVSTWIGGSTRHASHPSYQAWSYSALLRNFNEAVDEASGVDLDPCRGTAREDQ